MFGRNVDKAKLEVRFGLENFLAKAFKKFYIAIWSCMKLEDVLEILPMLMFDNFMDWFVFIWGREQCSKMFSEIYYYLKDLKHVYYNYHKLPYEKEDQTLLIDDEPSNMLWNPNWSGFFFNHSRDKPCQRSRCNDWT
jgi:hypothetical protein